MGTVLLALIALPWAGVGQILGQQVAPEGSTLIWSGARIEAVKPTQQEIPPECIGSAVTEGLVVAVGGFLFYKILSGLPLFGAPPPNGGSNVTAAVVFVAAGAAWAVWRAHQRCDGRIQFWHSTDVRRRRVEAGLVVPNRVGFSHHERSHQGSGARSLMPARPLTPAFPQF